MGNGRKTYLSRTENLCSSFNKIRRQSGWCDQASVESVGKSNKDFSYKERQATMGVITLFKRLKSEFKRLARVAINGTRHQNPKDLVRAAISAATTSPLTNMRSRQKRPSLHVMQFRRTYAIAVILTASALWTQNDVIAANFADITSKQTINKLK